MTPYRAIPRSVRELILRDLARQTRTPKAIAGRHHIPVEAVTALRNDFGPGPVELLRAAEELARPLKPAASPTAATAAAAPAAPTTLDASERKECRAWARTTGRTTAGTGPLPHTIVDAWIEAGRPAIEAPQPAPTPEPVEEVAPVAEEAAPVVDDDDHHDEEPVEEADADSAQGDVVDSSVVCGTCGQPLPDPWGDSCPHCGERFAGAGMTRELEWHVRESHILPPADALPAVWEDWPALFVRAAVLASVAVEWQAVRDAVEMLRDALTEHEHREQLVLRVRDAIAPQGLYLTADQVRLVLDAIEAA